MANPAALCGYIGTLGRMVGGSYMDCSQQNSIHFRPNVRYNMRGCTCTSKFSSCTTVCVAIRNLEFMKNMIAMFNGMCVLMPKVG